MLNKVYLLVIILVLNFWSNLFSQTLVEDNTLKIKIGSSNAKYAVTDSLGYKFIDYFEYTDPSKKGEFKLPQRYLIIAIPPSSNPILTYKVLKEKELDKTIPITNPTVSKLNDSTLVYNKNNQNEAIKYLPNKPIVKLGNKFWYRDFYCVEVIFNSHLFNPANNKIIINELVEIALVFDKNINLTQGSSIKIKSHFDEELRKNIYNSDVAEQFRSSKSSVYKSVAYNWINFNQDYVKISVPKDGIYRITESYLAGLGISTGEIDPKTFQIFESGIEQPIYVEGENDNSFDNGDYIEFYGEKNYSKTDYRQINDDDEPYNTFLNRYTDTSIYFLTWGTVEGKRYHLQNNNIIGQLDKLLFHTAFRHFEENSFYQNCDNNEVANQTANWNKNKNWYWNWLFVTTKNFNIVLDNLYSNEPGKVYFKLTSWGSSISTNSHQVALRFNNSKIDSQNVNRFDQALLSGNIPLSSLNSGSNTLTVQNYENGTLPNVFAYDWYEIEYPRYNVLVADSLIIKIPDGAINEIVEVNFTNAAAANYSIYKIGSDKKKIINYNVSNDTVSFRDTVSAGDKYAIFSESKVFIPSAEYIGKFTNLKLDNSQADYLAITSKQFNSSVASYINQVNTLYNLSVKQVFVEDIFNEFGYGYPSPESIKDFVKYAYDNWAAPKISYLTVIGDATNDYKGYSGVKLSNNIVPSFGNPVSDNWYAIWDENAPYIPQLKVGRIPINSSSDLSYYKSKLQNNFDEPYSDWNKKYTLFSGGKASDLSEILQLKSANDSVIANVIEPRPIGGVYTHFYKTTNPQSDFGPYSLAEVQEKIDEGGIIISYLGHSGTTTWDNSINNVSQLKNNVDRNPVISDFGCSTNKYAEPDIICFGELFLFDTDGQAINYVGNSSLGFLSTAVASPEYFYHGLLNSSNNEVGNAHIYLKNHLYNIFGNSSVFKVFSLSNVILGDPAARIKLPKKPNLLVNSNSLLIPDSITDESDSVKVKLVIENWGSAPQESYTLSVSQLHLNNEVNNKTKVLFVPKNKDTVDVFIMAKELTGENSVTIEVDPQNEIDEYNESDNKITYNFNVYSNAISPLLNYTFENGDLRSIKLLNPLFYEENVTNIIAQVSDDDSFQNIKEVTSPIDTLTTTVDISNEHYSGRNWVRFKLDKPGSNYSLPISYSTVKQYDFLLGDGDAFNKQEFEGTKYENGKLSAFIDTLEIEVYSAGKNAGANLAIKINGNNLLSNTFFAGMGLAVLDSSSYQVDTAEIYELYDKPEKVQELADFLNNLQDGKIVLMAVADDAKTRMNTQLKNAIKTIGSSKIDSLIFQGPWAIIGRKGADPNDPDILEQVGHSNSESITLNRNYVAPNITSYFTTTQLGPVSRWDTLYVEYSKPENSKIIVTPLGIRRNGELDSLTSFGIISSLSPLDHIDADKYPYAKFQFKLVRNAELESPTISQIGINHHNAAELAINYQTAAITKDTVVQNDSLGLSFKVSNVGEGRPLNVKAKVDLYKNNLIFKTLLDTTISYINPEAARDINLIYTPTTEDGVGNFKFLIELDPENKIVELYDDNNSFELPFTVVEDSVTAISSAVVSANFDGYEIYDGDYVSQNPKIEVFLDYEGHFEISDTNSIEIILNQKRISFADLNTTYETQNNRIIFSFQPELTDGDYTLSVLGDNIRSANSEANTFVRFFKVSSENKILYPYNFPNPFASETHFTFKLTQIPDELKIKVFTIAGRLIREIKVNREELNFDFNRIPWDGRDEDGDLLANGVYLYKVISYDSKKTVSVTSKLAIVR